MKRKKVLVLGYKKLNLGDDLFFSMLFNRYPNVTFYFCSIKEYKKVFKTYRNVKIISPYSMADIILSIIDKILRLKNNESILDRIVDYKVLITGSGFSEVDKHMFYKNHPLSNKRLVIIGTNFGPYEKKEFYSICYDYFSKCLDVCFRDSYSYKLFSKLENARIAPDIVLDIESLEREWKDIETEEDDYAVISLISLKNRTKNIYVQNSYKEGIIKISKFLINKGLKLRFISFCEKEGDSELLDEIFMEDEIRENSKHYVYNGNIGFILSVINSASTVVATRFHAMILGIAANKRVLPIVYNIKMENVLDDLEWSNYIATVDNVHLLTDSDLEEWYSNYHYQDFTEKKKESRKHFSILDDILNER